MHLHALSRTQLQRYDHNCNKWPIITKCSPNCFIKLLLNYFLLVNKKKCANCFKNQAFNTSLQDAYDCARNQIADLKTELEILKKEKSENYEEMTIIKLDEKIETGENYSGLLILTILNHIKWLRSNSKIFKHKFFL